MKILHLSDTHGKHLSLKNLPKADIIVHSGDISWNGLEHQVMDFIEWFCNLNYRYKIFVAGNHDDFLENKQIEGLPKNCHYLCNSGVEIENIKFWGIPYFISDDLQGFTPQLMDKIPYNTEILVTHRPPFGILDTTDNSYGCPDLLEAIIKIRPKYHLFGHVHSNYGIKKSDNTIFVNSSLTNQNYELVNKPVLLKIRE